MLLASEVVRPLTEGALGLSRGPDLSRYLMVCSGLLVLVVALSWGFRRLVAQKLASRAARRSLAVIDVLPLGGRRQLSVVRCYDRTFVLGLGEKDVRLIVELDPVIGAERAMPAPDEADALDFSRLLERARHRLGVPRRPSSDLQPAEREVAEVVA